MSKPSQFSLICVLIVFFYGLVTEEPYFTANGRGPNVFEFTEAILIVFNAPSRLISENISYFTYQQELRYFLSFTLWAILIPFQWNLYFKFTSFLNFNSFNPKLIFSASFLATILFIPVIYIAWQHGHKQTEHFVYKYFWVYRTIGLATLPLILTLLYRRALTRR